MTTFNKILIMGVIAVVAILAVVFFENNKEKELRKLSIVGELMARFKSIDLKSDIQTKNSSFRWNDGDGYTILVPATESFFAAKPERGCLERDLAVGIFSKELSAAEKVLAERGFVLDTNNSSVDALDNHLYDYIQAYKRDDEMCAVVVNPDCSSYQGGGAKVAHQLRVSCGNTFEKAKAEQIPFLEALELKNKNSIVRIKNQSGQFFQIGMGGFRAGSAAVLKKENESYRVLFIGQESPPCYIIDQEEIPNEVLSSVGGGGCFTDSGEYRPVQ